VAVLLALLESGAEIDKAADDDLTPLMIAVKNNDPSKTGQCHLAMVKALLGSRADVNKVLRDWCTVLMLAVMNGDLAVVEALLEAGADVETKMGERGVTALDLATHSGNAAVVAALQRHDGCHRS